jgi:hypothetical protein
VKRFLREYWLWIVVPMVLVLGAMAFLLLMTGRDDSLSPFDYPIF